MTTKFRSLHQVSATESTQGQTTTYTTTFDMTTVEQHEIDMTWQQAMFSPAGIILGLAWGIGGGGLAGALVGVLAGAIAAAMDYEFINTFLPVFYIAGGLFIIGGFWAFAIEEGEKALMMKQVKEERGTDKKWKVVKEVAWDGFVKALQAKSE
jgi:hypothetical protein